jgi:hypothetical protein
MKRHRWFLKNERDSPPANLLQLSRLRLQEILSLESDAALLNSSVCWKQPQELGSQCALSRSGFSQHSKGFAGLNLEAHTR